MEQNQRPRYQSTHLQTPDFWQRSKKYKMAKKKGHLTNGAGTTGYQHVEKWK